MVVEAAAGRDGTGGTLVVLVGVSLPNEADEDKARWEANGWSSHGRVREGSDGMGDVVAED